MKCVTVGQAGSQYNGITTKCCRRKTTYGQVLYVELTAVTKGRSWRERLVALHVDCMADMVKRAPAGLPARKSDQAAELDQLRAAAEAAVAS